MLGAAGDGGSAPRALGDVTLPVRAGGGGGGGCTAGGGGGGGAASAGLPTEADREGAATVFFSSSACAVSTASRVLPCAASCALTAAAAAFCRSRSRSSRSLSSLASLSSLDCREVGAPPPPLAPVPCARHAVCSHLKPPAPALHSAAKPGHACMPATRCSTSTHLFGVGGRRGHHGIAHAVQLLDEVRVTAVGKAALQAGQAGQVALLGMAAERPLCTDTRDAPAAPSAAGAADCA